MKSAWLLFGRLCFYAALPLLAVYLRIGERTRILVVCDKKALVVKGWLSNGRWSLPGGGLKANEQHKAGVLRELKEETGLDANKKTVAELGKNVQRGWLRFAYYQYVVVLPEERKLRAQPFEIVETKWLALSELTSNNAEQHVLDTIEAWRAHG